MTAAQQPPFKVQAKTDTEDSSPAAALCASHPPSSGPSDSEGPSDSDDDEDDMQHFLAAFQHVSRAASLARHGNTELVPGQQQQQQPQQQQPPKQQQQSSLRQASSLPLPTDRQGEDLHRELSRAMSSSASEQLLLMSRLPQRFSAGGPPPQAHEAVYPRQRSSRASSITAPSSPRLTASSIAENERSFVPHSPRRHVSEHHPPSAPASPAPIRSDGTPHSPVKRSSSRLSMWPAGEGAPFYAPSPLQQQQQQPPLGRQEDNPQQQLQHGHGNGSSGPDSPRAGRSPGRRRPSYIEPAAYEQSPRSGGPTSPGDVAAAASAAPVSRSPARRRSSVQLLSDLVSQSSPRAPAAPPLPPPPPLATNGAPRGFAPVSPLLSGMPSPSTRPTVPVHDGYGGGAERAAADFFTGMGPERGAGAPRAPAMLMGDGGHPFGRLGRRSSTSDPRPAVKQGGSMAVPLARHVSFEHSNEPEPRVAVAGRRKLST